MELAWFRAPTADDEGTLNLTYNAVDLPVIRGRAADPAITGSTTFDFAGLLEHVGAIAGAMRGLGVQPGHHVGVRLADPLRELLVLLACLRLGATCVSVDEGDRIEGFRPHAVFTDTALTFDTHVPAAVVLAGPEPVDETRDLAWDIALKAGRTDPAGCEPVSPGATAYVLDGPVTVAEVASDPSRFGIALRALTRGRPVDLRADEAPGEST